MLFSNTTSSTGYQVRSVANNAWLESTINYNNSPPVGGVLGSSGAITSGTWTSVDVTSFITGSGTFNLALTTSSTSPIDLVSREGGATAPKLVVEIAP
jgi:hypothetical protein